MANKFNKYGLPRNIPLSIKREVRQRDNFGCVLCAFPLVQYEHVDPLYCNAKEHTVSGITLLCPTCHSKVTNKLISKEVVKEAMINPMAKQMSEISDKLIFVKSHPIIKLAGVTFVDCKIPLQVRDDKVISITEDNGAYFINAKFLDSNGNLTLVIRNNEWIVKTDKIWDLEVVGNKVTIREKFKKPSLVFSIEENNTLIIHKLDMLIDGDRVFGDSEELNINSHKLSNVTAQGTEVGILIG